jgi:hypothetical protein
MCKVCDYPPPEDFFVSENTMDGQPITQLDCAECGQSVPLTAAKINDRGQAVHEECFVRRCQAELAERTKAS